MGSIAFVRWILGWVDFQIRPRRKGACERFLNLCARQGVALWRIGRSEEFFTAAIAVGRYEELRPLARKAGVRLKSGKRHGLPFLWKRVSSRKGILAGMVVFAVTLHIFSMYVWSVQVTGNTSIPSDQILTEAKNLGLSPGALKSRLEYQELQRRLMIAFPDVSWLSVNTQGCMIEIALEERIKHPEAENQEKISNLKASASGQIIKLEVTGGALQVKVGDAVVKGQLLVSGIAEDATGGTRMMRSSGKVIAETEKSLVAEIPMKQTVQRPTGKQIVRRSVRIFGLELPLSHGPPAGGIPKGIAARYAQRQNGRPADFSLYRNLVGADERGNYPDRGTGRGAGQSKNRGIKTAGMEGCKDPFLQPFRENGRGCLPHDIVLPMRGKYCA